VSKTDDAYRKFMVSGSLFSQKKFVRNELDDLKEDVPSKVHRYCKTCARETTWAIGERRSGTRGIAPSLDEFAGAKLVGYQCQVCEGDAFSVWVRTKTDGDNTPENPRVLIARKIGQTDPPDVAIAPSLGLDETSEDFYRKGLVSLSQGYGLGACGYFRRVVERETDRLIKMVEEAAKADGDQATLAKIEEARKVFSAEERLKIAADAKPSALRGPGNRNYLATLYGAYSKALHNGTEEKCVEIGEYLKEVFERVFIRLAESNREIVELEELASNVPQVEEPASAPVTTAVDTSSD
jgi:hypothetical protein